MDGTSRPGLRTDATGVTGFLGDLRVGVGLPPQLAGTAAGVVFVTVFLTAYVVSKSVVLPFSKRLLRRRGVDEHVRKPLTLLIYGVVPCLWPYAGVFARGLRDRPGRAVDLIAATLAVGFAIQYTLILSAIVT
jgi:hypothetical protein